MHAVKAPLARRAAESLLRAALRVWPVETREWGRALEAELCEIESPGAALHWAIGGFMLLGRSWWNHLLHSWKRPLGVPADGPLASVAAKATRLPRIPRIIIALLVVASAGLLLTRDFRLAMDAGIRAWGLGEMSEDEAILARLHAAANRTQDPQLLALYALVSWEDNSERMSAANEAVRRDPSLTWIYAKIRLLDDPCCTLHPADAAGVAALEKWDPENALPRLLAASLIYDRIEKRWLKLGERRGVFDDKRLVEQNPEWLAAMSFAFRAPKFDSYQGRAFDLYRSAVTRYHIQEPELALTVLMNTQGWEEGWQAGMYAERFMDQGQAAEQAGKFEEAATLYWKPVLFAQQILGQDHSDRGIQEVIYYERGSFQKLQPLLAKIGRRDEAEIMQYELSSLQAKIEAENTSNPYWRVHHDGWAGLMIRSLTATILLLSATILLCVGFIFFRRRADFESRGRGFAASCLGIDYAPLLLLLACAGLFAVYRPLALTYESYMSARWPVTTFGDLEFSVRAPYGMPEGFYRFSEAYLNSYHYWMIAITGLSVLAAYILYRGAVRTFRHGAA